MNDRPRNDRLVGLAAIVGAVLSFSISSSLVKWAQTQGSVIAVWRLLLSVVLWWIVIGVRRQRFGTPPPSSATWRAMVLPGLLFGLNITTFFVAIGKTSIAHAEFLASLSPLLLVPIGALVFHERPNWPALVWAIPALVGLALVLFTGGHDSGATVTGDLLILLTLLTWVGYLATGRRARQRVRVIDFMSTVMPLALLAATPIALVQARDELWPVSGRGWVVIGVLTVLTGMLAHGLIAFAQRVVAVSTIGVVQVSQPALAVGWAWLILDEAIRPAQVPGMILVAVGMIGFVLADRRSRARAATPEPVLPGFER